MQMGRQNRYSKKDSFTQREREKKNGKKNKKKTTTRKKEKWDKNWGTDEVLMFIVGKDSALFSGL